MTEIVPPDYIAIRAISGCYYLGMQAAGYVLTGGNSIRMGRDKALLPHNGIHLVETVAHAVSSVVGNVALVGQPHRYQGLPWRCIPDLRSDAGPAAGLEALLQDTECGLNLVVACDMPSLDIGWLRKLVDAAECSTALCTATKDRDGRIHPLCAVYRKECLPVVSRALDTGNLKLMTLLNHLGAEYLLAEIPMENVNTPLDWDRWERSAGVPCPPGTDH